VPDDVVHPGYEYLGNGPAATGSGPAWSMRPDLYARCVRCGDFISLDPAEYGHCACRAMQKDPDAGRFGSALGDSAIEIYRQTEQRG
jgi:hypothetical protein